MRAPSRVLPSTSLRSLPATLLCSPVLIRWGARHLLRVLAHTIAFCRFFEIGSSRKEDFQFEICREMLIAFVFPRQVTANVWVVKYYKTPTMAKIRKWRNTGEGRYSSRLGSDIAEALNAAVWSAQLNIFYEEKTIRMFSPHCHLKSYCFKILVVEIQSYVAFHNNSESWKIYALCTLHAFQWRREKNTFSFLINAKPGWTPTPVCFTC